VGTQEKNLTLDLHGVPHEEVEGIVHQFINANWGPNRELHIITGHSVRMKSIVMRVMRMYDVEVMPFNPANPGYIRVQTWSE
jgi:hypothetical protein